MRNYWAGIVFGFFVAAMPAPALAIREFNKVFEKRYLQATASPELQLAYRKAKCNTCHVKGKKKDVCNSYGVALAQLLEGNVQQRLDAAKEAGRRKEELQQIVRELEVALEKVEQQPDTDGRPFGELLRSGLLPVPLPMTEAGAEDEPEDEEQAEQAENETAESPTPATGGLDRPSPIGPAERQVLATEGRTS